MPTQLRLVILLGSTALTNVAWGENESPRWPQRAAFLKARGKHLGSHAVVARTLLRRLDRVELAGGHRAEAHGALKQAVDRVSPIAWDGASYNGSSIVSLLTMLRAQVKRATDHADDLRRALISIGVPEAELQAPEAKDTKVTDQRTALRHVKRLIRNSLIASHLVNATDLLAMDFPQHKDILRLAGYYERLEKKAEKYQQAAIDIAELGLSLGKDKVADLYFNKELSTLARRRGESTIALPKAILSARQQDAQSRQTRLSSEAAAVDEFKRLSPALRKVAEHLARKERSLNRELALLAIVIPFARDKLF